MKELYIIRHGETDLNQKGIVQGKGVNLPLNDKGREQAKLFFQAYKDVPFDVVFTSTLLRAQQSVEGFLVKGIPHECYAQLDEISWGNMEGNQAVMENSHTFLNLLEAWRKGDIDAKPPGGESPRELQARQIDFIENVLRKTTASKILICMHGRAIRCLMCTFTQRPLSEMENFQHANLTLYKVLLHDDGRAEIILNNHQDHLR